MNRKKQSFIDIYPSVRDFTFKSFTVEFYEGLKKANIIQFEFTAHWTINMCMKKKSFCGCFCLNCVDILYVFSIALLWWSLERRSSGNDRFPFSRITLFSKTFQIQKNIIKIKLYSFFVYTSLDNAKNEMKICRSICFTAYFHKFRKIWTLVVQKRHGNAFYLPIHICYIKKQV